MSDMKIELSLGKQLFQIRIKRWVDRWFAEHDTTVRSFDEFLTLGPTAEPVKKFKDPKQSAVIRVTAKEFSVGWLPSLISPEEALLSLGADILMGVFPLGMPKVQPVPGSKIIWRVEPEYSEWDEYATKKHFSKVYMRFGWYYTLSS